MPKKVLVYGNLVNAKDTVAIRDEIELSYKLLGDQPNLEDFDALIFDDRTFSSRLELLPDFEKQITAFLAKGKPVCFTFFQLDEIFHPSSREAVESMFNQSSGRGIAIKYLHKLWILNRSLQRIETHIVTQNQAFRSFVEKFATSYSYFVKDPRSCGDIQAICTVRDNPGLITSFSTRYFGGILIFMCGIPKSNRVDDFYFALARSVLDYSIALSPVDLSWLGEFCLRKEAPLRKDKTIHENALSKINKQLIMYDELKAIVGYKEYDLQDNLPIWIEKYLRLHTFREEKYKEDFWITTESKEKIIIGESKSGGGNLKHSDISKLDYHRGDLGYEKTFPALLVANTFMNATSLKEKDQDFHPDIVRKATDDNVLIMRVLDLIRMYDYIENNPSFTAQTFVETVKNKAGWLKFKEEGYELLP